jgi:tetratricopeptide (TPR) repeat protein
MLRTITLLCFALLLLCGGCDRREATSETATSETVRPTATGPAEQVSPSQLSTVLHDPVELKRYEVSSQALQQWYDFRVKRPTLLLYANDPLMQSTSPAIQKELLTRLAKNDQTALRADVANPAILPKMTLQAALKAGLFSEVYWVMPANAEMSEMSVDIFRTQMIQLGAVDEKEAHTFTLRSGVFSGTVAGLPFHAVHPQAEFTLSGPTAFHFDLSYMSQLYKGEIKTPIFPLIYQTLWHLQDQRVEIVSASFSYSQLTREVPLGSRFIGEIFEQLFSKPEMLDEKLPAAWQARANALYLPELMIAEKARNSLLQQVENIPDDASLHYALYDISRKVKSARQEALGHLATAVKLDPGYALEYLVLAQTARVKGRPDAALNMLHLAHEAYSDNPFITLELARNLLAEGQGDSAASLLQELLALDWSSTIYPNMPQFLQQLLTQAKSSEPIDHPAPKQR